MAMNKWKFIIGSVDDFDSQESLIRAATVSPIDVASNYSVFEYALPPLTEPVTVLMYGRGLAFSSDWIMDGTVSALVVG
jgi:hypothetical protein